MTERPKARVLALAAPQPVCMLCPTATTATHLLRQLDPDTLDVIADSATMFSAAHATQMQVAVEEIWATYDREHS